MTRGQTLFNESIFKLNVINNASNLRNWSSISLLFPDQYHDPTKLLEELQQIADTAPEIVDLFTIGNSVQGREIYCLRITNEQNIYPKAGVLFVAHHHAREQITVEAALRFLVRLVNNYGVNQKITEYIDHEEIFIIPTLNPDGLFYVVEEENFWLRRNLSPIDDDNDGITNEDPTEDTNGDGIISEYDIIDSNTGEFLGLYFEGIDTDSDGTINEDGIGGVDLNRNYDYKWNDSSLDSGWGTDTSLEDYPGTAPFSEPETQAYRDFLENKSFASAISLHSGINATYFPWSSEPYWAEKPLYEEIYSDLKGLLPTNFFSYVESPEYSGYTCAGEWGDWMYSVKDCMVPMTFEIYHNQSADYAYELNFENATHQIWQWDGIYEYFTPVESAIDPLWEDIRSVFDYWLANTPRIQVTIESINTASNITGNYVWIQLAIKNLSPRLRTIDNLRLMYQNFSFVLDQGEPVTISDIPADKTRDTTLEIELEHPIKQEEGLTLLIGNKFVGYTPFTIQNEFINKTQTSTSHTTIITDTSTQKVSTTPYNIITSILTVILVIVAVKNRFISKKEDMDERLI